MNDKICFWQADKHRSLLQIDIIILGECNQACPKYPNNFTYLAISPEKHGGEVDFLAADKQKKFLQVDSITLGVHSQACPKYPKQQV